MEYEKLKLEKANGVATITLNRPEKSNAFDEPLIQEMIAALDTVDRDVEVRCVVITGAGKNFCAGQDLDSILARYDSPEGISFRDHLLNSYNRIVPRIRTIEKPFIAAINGAAAGAGLGLVCACDLRHASANARFRMAFVAIGLAPDSGTSYFLPRIIGLGRAMELALTNELIDAEKALSFGLVNRVFPPDELIPRTIEFAHELAIGPTKGMGLTKRAFNHSLLADIPGALDYEAHVQEIAGRSLDHREGVKAFTEKRPPAFVGK